MERKLTVLAILLLGVISVLGQGFTLNDTAFLGSRNGSGSLTVTGALLWVQSDSGVTLNTQGSLVTAWLDKSGNANNIVGTGTTSFQTNQLNGFPSVRMSGSGVLNTTLVKGQPFAILLVANTFNSLGSGIAMSSNPEIYMDSDFIHILLGSDIVSGTSWPSNQYNYVTFVADGTSSTIRQNGVQVASGSGGVSSLLNFNLAGNGGFDFDVVEMIVTTNMNSVTNNEKYVKGRYPSLP